MLRDRRQRHAECGGEFGRGAGPAESPEDSRPCDTEQRGELPSRFRRSPRWLTPKFRHATRRVRQCRSPGRTNDDVHLRPRKHRRYQQHPGPCGAPVGPLAGSDPKHPTRTPAGESYRLMQVMKDRLDPSERQQPRPIHHLGFEHTAQSRPERCQRPEPKQFEFSADAVEARHATGRGVWRARRQDTAICPSEFRRDHPPRCLPQATQLLLESRERTGGRGGEKIRYPAARCQRDEVKPAPLLRRCHGSKEVAPTQGSQMRRTEPPSPKPRHRLPQWTEGESGTRQIGRTTPNCHHDS